MLDRYLAQVRLLLSVLPEIAREPAFALKGGTAINLFYRDLPRLSVDLDLTWVPVADRRSSLREIDDTLDRIAAAIARRYSRFDARRVAGGGGGDTRIMVTGERSQVKIETSPVTRGTVYPTRSMPASDAVIERFGFVEANVLAFEDLYGGKLLVPSTPVPTYRPSTTRPPFSLRAPARINIAVDRQTTDPQLPVPLHVIRGSPTRRNPPTGSSLSELLQRAENTTVPRQVIVHAELGGSVCASTGSCGRSSRAPRYARPEHAGRTRPHFR